MAVPLTSGAFAKRGSTGAGDDDRLEGPVAFVRVVSGVEHGGPVEHERFGGSKRPAFLGSFDDGSLSG